LLGWLGEETFAGALTGPMVALFERAYGTLGLSFFDPEQSGLVTAHAIASVLAIIVVTFFHITLGEQIPKMLSLQRAETFILFNIQPMIVIGWIFRPFVWLLTTFVIFVLRLLRMEYRGDEQTVHSPEELQLLVSRAARAGLMTAPERELVERAFAFADLVAGEVMVPRTEVVAIPVEATIQDAIRLAMRHRYSRFPVYEQSIDNVIGVLSTKDLLSAAARRGARTSTAELGVRRLIRPPLLVPEGAEVSEVLARMKAARLPMAIVLDEYGGTAGIVTLKDLMARLVGEMGDEYAPPAHEVRRLPDGSVLVDGLALVEDVNAELGTRFDASEVDTMGGLVFSRLGRRPRIGDEVEIDAGWRGRVERLDGLRIARIRLLPVQDAAARGRADAEDSPPPRVSAS
jgi:putative hemolysin